ncbi:MAG: M56 family metallopeptidase, partial [Bacteroidota bacterium]
APAYYFLLRYSERYGLNRWLLLLGLTVVCLLPAVEFPSPAPAATQELQGSISSLVRSVNGEATPVSLTTETRSVTDAEGNMTLMLHDRPFGFGKVQVGYLLGLVVMLLLLGVRLFALLRAYVRSRPGDFPADFRVLTTVGDPGQAFTFFRQIYLGEDVVDDPDLPLILAHERVHARQLHTLDVLFSEFFLCLFWFHPVAWWLRARLRANLEYLVDATVVRRTAKRDYQLALVRQSTQAYGLALALPFSEPTLRGRIQRIANLPRHWGVAATAALALILWLGTAMLVMRGTTAVRSAVPNVYSIYDQAQQSGDPVELALATHHSRIRKVVTEPIQSFALYFRRLPTPDEAAQIKGDIIHQIALAENTLQAYGRNAERCRMHVEVIR